MVVERQCELGEAVGCNESSVSISREFDPG